MLGLVGERELTRPEPQRRLHGAVELAHRSLAQLLDAEVERPGALHRSVCEPLHERAIACVQPGDGGLEHAVGVCILFEDTPQTVIINEALEIARRFSTFEATQFINGILDAIKHDLEAAKNPPEPVEKSQASSN